jgi:hypothetical protein
VEGPFHGGILTWNLEKVAEALQLNEQEAMQYFTDGRRVSFILERRICREVLKGTLAESEGAGYDLLDKNGLKWEVRSITNKVYFCPSYMVGKDRSFHEPGFLAKLDAIEGYFLADVQRFPNVPYWIVPVDLVRELWHANRLNKTTSISRKRALRLIADGTL